MGDKGSAMASGLYVHVPFCASVCPFCAFAVCLDNAAAREGYLAAVSAEAVMAAAAWGEALGEVGSVYVGGGTPSSLEVRQAERLLKGLRGCFSIAGDAEITWELNPEDVGADYLRGLADLGVNRVSLGLQSFDDKSLRALGRRHRKEQSHQAAEAVATGAIANYNLDLMLGAPYIGESRFCHSLFHAMQFEPPHLSLYALELESHTPFGRSADLRDWHRQQQDSQAETMLWAIQTLQQRGWQQYEVSNFSKPQRQSKQNLLVWQHGHYLGLGPSAHSYLEQRRWANQRSLKDWQQAIGQQQLPIAWQEHTTPQQRANEALMLALRQTAGLNITQWQQQFHTNWTVHQQHISQQWVQLQLAARQQDVLWLTPQGLLLADALTPQLMLA